MNIGYDTIIVSHSLSFFFWLLVTANCKLTFEYTRLLGISKIQFVSKFSLISYQRHLVNGNSKPILVVFSYPNLINYTFFRTKFLISFCTLNVQFSAVLVEFIDCYHTVFEMYFWKWTKPLNTSFYSVIAYLVMLFFPYIFSWICLLSEQNI